MYKFTLPIGDWSNDGHGKCTYYVVSSNKSVEEVREIHFKIPEATGIDIHKICNKYEDCTVDDEVVEELQTLGFEMNDDNYMCDDRMAELWIFLLIYVDKNLELTIIKDDLPMLPFYGMDKKGRHISFVGYGVFD